MRRLSAEEVAEVGKYVSDSPNSAISIRDLARALGVTYVTAKRRLEAYAASQGAVLQTARSRIGARGPESVTYFLSGLGGSQEPGRLPADSGGARVSPSAASEVNVGGQVGQRGPPPEDEVTVPGPIELRVRAAFMEAIPRDMDGAVTTSALLARVRASLPPDINRNTLSVYFSRLVREREAGVVRTTDGMVFLDESGANTHVVAGLAGDRANSRRSSAAPSGEAPSVVTRRVRGLDELLDGSDDTSIGLDPSVVRALQSEELLVLRLLARSGEARATELAERVGRRPGRFGGMMRALRRKLHALGLELFVDDSLPDGETMFRYVGRGSR